MVAEGDPGEAPEVDEGAVERWIRALRRCVRCGEPKPMGEFYARQDRPGRERPHCRTCHSEMTMLWQRENRTRKNETNRRYRERNRDSDRERSRRNRAKRQAEREA